MKKIAIITGASSGLGRDFVKQIDRKYNLDEIWMIARREEKMNNIAKKLKKAKGIVIKADLLKLEEIEKISEKLYKEKPKVCILVNSAGFGKIGNFIDLSLEEQLSMIDLNVKALTALTYKVIPYMPKGSRIIQIASSAGFLPQPGFNIYAATKAFVIHFSKALNIELKQKRIKVLAVCPGPVKTEFFNIASSKGKPLDWKSKLMVNSRDVVCKALRDSDENKMESIYGSLIKGFKIISRIIPHSIILKLFKWN
ncbi:SDR family NAD(P)-dependent oxidoreductase [Defluviitalea phaphyphila]|uniref:SDR family NAD(P)-dependent oxidoreductase n=1 Tax=Defluviitalea phaphyphila TaxID=1473580 RepID=UPI000730F5A5|nr:SDR family NAD(P)-dependent oxidoreductase [Defluviitalea phaphyphila]